MAYYMGDYKAGYYMGDPGFFSFIGKAIKGVAKVAGGLLGVPTGGGKTTVIREVTPMTQAIVKRVPTSVRRVAGGAITAARAHPGITAAIGGAAAGISGTLATRGLTHVLGGGGGVGRRRRMNVTNVHALRRAIRRCTGFSRLAKRVLRFTSPKPPRGRAYFKAPRRKRKVC